MEDTQFFANHQPINISNDNTQTPTNQQFILFSSINGHHSNPNQNLLTSTSWSSSSSSGLEETFYEYYDHEPIAIEIAPSTLSKTGSQMMLVENASSSNLLSLMPANNVLSPASNIYGNDPFSSAHFGVEQALDSFSMVDSNPNIQLWQFLLECLEDPQKRYRDIIRWTNNNMSPTPPPQDSSSSTTRATTSSHAISEFCILEPRELAKRWAVRRALASKKSDDEIIYLHPAYIQRFNRVMRYYHNKKRVLHKLVGKPNTYVFLVNIQPYLNMLRAAAAAQQQQHDRMLL